MKRLFMSAMLAASLFCLPALATAAPAADAAPAAQKQRTMPERDAKGRFISTPKFSASKGSDVYHKDGCRYFDKKAELTFKNEAEAKKAGLRPCKLCIGK